LLPMMHSGTEQILIKCENIKSLNDTIRKLQKVKWSQTYKCWYLPLNKESYTLICNALQALSTINTEELRKYLLKKKCKSD